MIRATTFSALALAIGLAAIKVSIDNELFVTFMMAIVIFAMVAAFNFCDRGRFADFLTDAQIEVDKIAWPNLRQLVRGIGLVLTVFVIVTAISVGIQELVDAMIGFPGK